MKCFTYWEGKKKPYIELCFKTMEKYCPEIIRLDENTCRDYVDLPKEYDRIGAINHKVDYLKAKLILEHGGWWFDADTILLKRPPEVDSTYRGCPGLFGAEKGCEEIKMWVDYMDKKIKQKSKFFWSELITPVIYSTDEWFKIKNIEDWLKYDNTINSSWKNDMVVQVPPEKVEFAIRIGAISPAKDTHKLERFVDEIRNIDKKEIHPWFGTNNMNFLAKEEKTEIPDETWAVILYNHAFGDDKLLKLNQKQILASGTRLSNLLNKALYEKD